MARPQKCRRVCRLPEAAEFRPAGKRSRQGAVVLAVDEYEAIRLIDKEGFSQTQCSQYMNVSRTTVQEIYTAARKKIATALVDGVSLRIEGGVYRLCGGEADFCGCWKKHGGCHHHKKEREES